MFRKIKEFFNIVDWRSHLLLKNQEAFGLRIMDLEKRISKTESLQHEWNSKLNASIAECIKRLSSIEMELLLGRGACLDNNFEGKENL